MNIDATITRKMLANQIYQCVNIFITFKLSFSWVCKNCLTVEENLHISFIMLAIEDFGAYVTSPLPSSDIGSTYCG